MRDKEIHLREELERLSTSELEMLLREELENDSLDGDRIREIMCILRQRDANDPRTVPPNVELVWQKIQNEHEVEKPDPKSRKYNPLGQIAKVALIAAVLVVVLFGVPHAFGVDNIIELVAVWTDDTFQFLKPGETIASPTEYVFITEHLGLQELYDAVSELGVKEPVVPMWVPEEMELAELKIGEEFGRVTVYARMEGEDRQIIFQLSVVKNDDFRQSQFVKDEGGVEKKEIGEVVHYIMCNTDKMVATWKKGCVECFVSTNVEKSVLYDVLESIYRKG